MRLNADVANYPVTNVNTFANQLSHPDFMYRSPHVCMLSTSANIYSGVFLTLWLNQTRAMYLSTRVSSSIVKPDTRHVSQYMGEQFYC